MLILIPNVDLHDELPTHSTASFALSKPASAESLGLLRTVISNAVATGSREIVIDVDDIGILDFPIIAVLISILRQSTEGGAFVSLRAKRQSILDTLRITALNKVFTILSTDAVPSLPAPPSPRGKRIGAIAR
jgi:anti-anti-sigma factor